MDLLKSKSDPLLPVVNDFPFDDSNFLLKSGSDDDVLSDDLACLLGREWNALCLTWQYDPCLLSIEYSQCSGKVQVPSLFTFVSVTLQILNKCGHLDDQPLDPNQMFAQYRELSTNIDAVFFFNYVLEPPNCRLWQKGGNVELMVITKSKEQVTFSPHSVFGTNRFISGKAYALTEAFRKKFTNNTQLIVFSKNIHQPPFKTSWKPSLSQAIVEGSAFDYYFPCIKLPEQLYNQLRAPPSEGTGLIQLGRKLFTGCFVIMTGVRETQILAPTFWYWKSVSPAQLLDESDHDLHFCQIDWMYTMLETVAKCQQPAEESSLSAWMVQRAFQAAQTTVYTSFTNERDTPPYRFKIICLTWKVLRAMFKDAQVLFSLMIRTFCLACSERRRWCFLQKTLMLQQHQPIDAKYHHQTCVVSTVWNITTQPGVIQNIKQSVNATMATNLHHKVWWYMCPFMVTQDDLSRPILRLCEAFKVNYES